MWAVRTKLACALVVIGLAAGVWAAWERVLNDTALLDWEAGPYELLKPLLKGEPQAQYVTDISEGMSTLLGAQYTLAPTLLIPGRDMTQVVARLGKGVPLICHLRSTETLDGGIRLFEQRAAGTGFEIQVTRLTPTLALLKARAK